jgi:hypothetical protein
MADSYLNEDEALAEARRRWGPRAEVQFPSEYGWASVGTREPNIFGWASWPFGTYYGKGWGSNVEEAFKDADKEEERRQRRIIEREDYAFRVRQNLKG